ncbi:MAG TPA: DegV family protein [Acidimicrobiales bacterium]
MTVSVVTDSAASLPSGEVIRLGISVVPFNLILDGVAYRDGELRSDEVIAAAGDRQMSTSCPSPGEFAKAIDDHGIGDGTVLITVASTMSSSYHSAMLASRYFRDGQVHVVDSRTAAGAQGLVILAAAEAAASGASLDEVIAAAEYAARKVRLVASIENFQFLARSGRVPAVTAWAANTIGMRALFEFSNGEPLPLRPSVGQKAALDRIVRSIERPCPGEGILRIAVLHAQAIGVAERLANRIRSANIEAELFISPFSSVMVAHTGPGVVGAAWWRDDSRDLSGYSKLAA